MTDVWNVDAVPADYTAPGEHASFRFTPTAKGISIIRNKLPPDSLVHGADAVDAELLHRTRTVDFIQVLEGEIWAVMESGDEAKLVAGDCLVQRGTVHAWRNRSSAPAVFLAVMIAGDEATLPAEPLGAKPIDA